MSNNKPKLPKKPKHLKAKVGDVKDFTKIAMFIFIFGDLLLCYYIWSLFSSFEHFKSQIDLALAILKSVPNFPMTEIPESFHIELYSTILQTLKIIIAGFLFVHGLIYLSFYKEQNFALKYIKLMVWPAGISCFLIGFAETKVFDFTYLFFPIGILYIYSAIHLKKLRHNESGFIW